MELGGVFINYRGADSHALLYVELSNRFGVDLVFLDSESILVGVDFVSCLLRQVRQAWVLLVVMGRLAGDHGRRWPAADR
jgi:hypothetical protein